MTGSGRWSEQDVHEALLRWGAMRARRDDGGLGYPSQSSSFVELRSRPYRALEPGEFAACEFGSLESAITHLSAPLKVVVLCYYKPGHLRSRAPASAVDGRRCARAPSLRTIAGALLISKDLVDARLRAARACIAAHLTGGAGADRIAGIR